MKLSIEMLNQMIEDEINNSIKKKINKRKSTEEEILEDDSDKENLYPGMKDFKKLSRGVLEENDTISGKEWNALKNRVKGIFRLMPTDRRREELRDFTREFGLMYFNDFLRIQDQMIDSSKGDLGKPDK